MISIFPLCFIILTWFWMRDYANSVITADFYVIYQQPCDNCRKLQQRVTLRFTARAFHHTVLGVVVHTSINKYEFVYQ